MGGSSFLVNLLTGAEPVGVPLSRPRSRGGTLSRRTGEGRGEGWFMGSQTRCCRDRRLPPHRRASASSEEVDEREGGDDGQGDQCEHVARGGVGPAEMPENERDHQGEQHALIHAVAERGHHPVREAIEFGHHPKERGCVRRTNRSGWRTRSGCGWCCLPRRSLAEAGAPSRAPKTLV